MLRWMLLMPAQLRWLILPGCCFAAFDAAWDADVAAAAAMVAVRRRLDDIGVIGPAATFLLLLAHLLLHCSTLDLN